MPKIIRKIANDVATAAPKLNQQQKLDLAKADAQTGTKAQQPLGVAPRRKNGTVAKPATPICPACNDTGKNSNGGQCAPCLEKGRIKQIQSIPKIEALKNAHAKKQLAKIEEAKPNGQPLSILDGPAAVEMKVEQIKDEELRKLASNEALLARVVWESRRWRELTAGCTDIQVDRVPVGASFIERNGRVGEVVSTNNCETRVQIVRPGGKVESIGWCNTTTVTPVSKLAAQTAVKLAAGKVKVASNGQTKATSDGQPRLPGKARTQIYGHSSTRVVMWLGKRGYAASEAAKFLQHHGVESTPASIATFLRSGVKGDRGEVAPLTAEQEAEARKIIGR